MKKYRGKEMNLYRAMVKKYEINAEVYFAHHRDDIGDGAGMVRDFIYVQFILTYLSMFKSHLSHV